MSTEKAIADIDSKITAFNLLLDQPISVLKHLKAANLVQQFIQDLVEIRELLETKTSVSTTPETPQSHAR
jgi:hypothetical protein